MEAIKTILIILGILFIIQIITAAPLRTRFSTIQDCASTDGSFNIGCIQELNRQYYEN